MATRPLLFDWASDVNWSSGPRSGNATKLTPSAGEQAQGHVGGISFKSEHANWALNLASLGLGWTGDQIANVLDGGTEGGNTELRDAIGLTGVTPFYAVAGVSAGTPVVGASAPAHRDPLGPAVRFAREQTTVGGAETLVIMIPDTSAYSGVFLIEYFVVSMITGAVTPIDAVGQKGQLIGASRSGTMGLDGSVETFDIDSAGGAGLVGLTFSTAVVGTTVALRINDSSSPRVIRTTGWFRAQAMNATG